MKKEEKNLEDFRIYYLHFWVDFALDLLKKLLEGSIQTNLKFKDQNNILCIQTAPNSTNHKNLKCRRYNKKIVSWRNNFKTLKNSSKNLKTPKRFCRINNKALSRSCKSKFKNLNICKINHLKIRASRIYKTLKMVVIMTKTDLTLILNCSCNKKLMLWRCRQLVLRKLRNSP